MPATIRPVGMLKEYIQGQDEIQVPAGQTVRAVLQGMRLPSEVVALVLVGDRAETKDYLLQEGDLVRLMAVIGGG